MNLLEAFIRSSVHTSRKYSRKGDNLPKAFAKGAGETLLYTLLTICGIILFVVFLLSSL